MLTLAEHQKRSVARARHTDLALFHDCGTGKTITGLAIYIDHKRTEPHLRLLVVASPKVLLKTSWPDDIRKFCPEFSYCTLKELDIKNVPDIVLTNYEYLRTNGTRIAPLLTRYRWMCVLDESTHIKNHKSLTWKTLKKLQPLFSYRYVMTGTPAPNNLLDVWTQMTFVKPNILGTSFYGFRRTYGEFCKIYGDHKEVANTSLLNSPEVARAYMQRGFKWRIRDDMTEVVMRKIAPLADWVKETDVLDLPEQNFQTREFELSLSERKAYREMYRDMIMNVKGETISVDTAVARLMKLRQVCSGYAYRNGGIIEIGDSKLKALGDMLETIGDQQAVIWVHFRRDGDLIERLIRDIGRTYSLIRSGNKDKDEQSRRFVNGDTQFMLASTASAAHGLTWTNCHIAVYYSMDYNYETYYQSTKRIHRRGQNERCNYYHLAAHDTVEPQIIKALQDKESAAKLLEEMTL